MALKKEDVSSSTMTATGTQEISSTIQCAYNQQNREAMDYGNIFGYRVCIEHIMTYREVALLTVAASPMAREIGSLMEQKQALLTGRR